MLLVIVALGSVVFPVTVTIDVAVQPEGVSVTVTLYIPALVTVTTLAVVAPLNAPPVVPQEYVPPPVAVKAALEPPQPITADVGVTFTVGAVPITTSVPEDTQALLVAFALFLTKT